MTLREVYERIDALYPKKISDDYVKTYGGHDNSGILLDPGREILGALFSLDLSLAAIEEAKKTGKNLIVTHHPAIFFPVSNILRSDPLGARLIACLEAGIGVISPSRWARKKFPPRRNRWKRAATAEFFPSKSRRSPTLRRARRGSFPPPAPSCTARGNGKSDGRHPSAARA